MGGWGVYNRLYILALAACFLFQLKFRFSLVSYNWCPLQSEYCSSSGSSWSMSGLVSCVRKPNRSHLWMRGESRSHSITLPKVSHRLYSMRPFAFMLCCKHIPTSREHGNVLERAVQTLPEAPDSQLIHGGKHHFKMVRTAGH